MLPVHSMWMTKGRVLIESDLAVEGENPAVGGLHQRIDLNECRVLVHQRPPQLDEDVGYVCADGLREVGGIGDVTRERGSHSLEGIHADLRESFGFGCRHFFDIHTTLDARHREERAIRSIEEERHVVLLSDVRSFGD